MPERLIGRALELGARFAHIRRPDPRTLIVSCDAASADTLLAICQRFSIPAMVLSRRGMSAAIQRARRRATLPIGIAVFAALCWFFLGHIWIVDIAFTGQSAALGDREAFRRDLAEAHLSPGISRGVDTGLIAQSLAARQSAYSYVGAHLQGVRLLIEAVPEVPAPPLYDVEAARDLVSDRDGIVVSANVRSGALCVKPGDAVRRGQLLIRGEEKAAADETRPIAALGEVVVRAWYEGSASLPTHATRVEYTGRAAVSSALCLFSWRWPILVAEGFDDMTAATEYLPVGGLYLPLAIQRTTLREVRRRQEALNANLLRAQLARLALADAALALAREGPRDYEIVRSWTDYDSDGDAMRAHAVYEIHANAAVSRSALAEDEKGTYG